MPIETNIRIVKYGPDLYIHVREAIVEGTDLSPDIIQRACGTLQFRKGIAAIPHPTAKNRLLVASPRFIKEIRLKESNWAVQIRDSGNSARKYHWANTAQRAVVTQLIERALIAQLAMHTDFWTLDSPHIWYEPGPFVRKDGIVAYRRYSVGAIDVEDVGVGIIVEVSTAFFTENALDYFFAEGIDKTEQDKRLKAFERLTDRQKGKKGTLLYHIADHYGKCYFVEAPPGLTCSTKQEIRIDGTSYESLGEYYKEKYSTYKCNLAGRAVRVSFPNYSRPTLAAADCLYVRVMNDSLPEALKQVDKIRPDSRRKLTQRFWKALGDKPFGHVVGGVEEGLWQPPPERVVQFPLPELLFPEGQRLASPPVGDVAEYKNYFRSRLEMLDELGCYDSPPTMPRVIHLAYPTHLAENPVVAFAVALEKRLQDLTRRNIQIEKPIAYESIDDAIEVLSKRNAQIVVFILDDDPTAYYKAAYNQKWHIKRVTEGVLLEQVEYLNQGKHGRWQSFITMNALGIVQLLNAVPYALPHIGQYEAQLAIDVGPERRHYALSLLIARENGDPSFRLFTKVLIKPDSQHDTINPIILRDAVVSLFKSVLEGNVDALKSLLVLRDGEFLTLKDGASILREEDGVLEAVERLKALRMLEQNAEVHLVDFRKQTNRTVRFWQVDEANRVENPLEGTGIIINHHYVALATTGVATLPPQGAAHPVVVTSNGHCPNIVEAARSVFDAAQLNLSSPKVAQRLPQTVNAADEQLEARDAQEIRRVT
jgi:hypothetical protein